MGNKIRIPRALLEKITREELARHIYEITDGFSAMREKEKKDGEEKEKAQKKKPPGAETIDAEKDGKGKDMAPSAKSGPVGKPDGKGPKKGPGPDMAKDAEPPEQPIEKEPADDDLSQQAADAPDEPDDKESEKPGGDVSDGVTGKTIQSLTLEPKSKLMPGAQEIVLTFNEIPEPLKILISKAGTVKYFWRGGLHNQL
jgi:hypothetical protein